MTIARLFIANRGEIAVRIVRTCRELGIESVVGVSTADRDSLAAELADRAVVIGPAHASESYLRVETIVQAVDAAEKKVAALEAQLAEPELYSKRSSEVPALNAKLAAARIEAAKIVTRWEALEAKKGG